MLLRAKFAKLKPVRYISHLELMDTFRKSFRRANLPVAFSQGYNPHIQLSLCQPLSVGMIGEGEYFDLNLTKKVDRVLLLNRINKFVPRGIKVFQAKYIPEKVKSLQAVINCAIYQIQLNFSKKISKNMIDRIIRDFLNKKKIVINRVRRNKSDRKLDLKPMIYEIKSEKPDLWNFTVSTGSSGNVRASELIKALAKDYSFIKEVPVINIVRKGLYVRKNKKLYFPYVEEIVGR